MIDCEDLESKYGASACRNDENEMVLTKRSILESDGFVREKQY